MRTTNFGRPPLNRQHRPPESLVHLYLYSLRGHSPLIEVSRREAYLVVPVDGERVEAERLEVVEVLELAADALLHQRRKVHQPHLAQMIQEMEENLQAEQALTTTGLDDWFQDLKAKNEAFLAKMNERTEAQAGQQKGIVREKRLLAEAAYKNVVKLLNAAAIMEILAELDYNPVIDRLNAEVEHYRQILARKGTSTGTNSGGDGGSSDGGDNGGSDGGDTPTPTPTPEPTPDSDPTPSGGGDDEPGGDDH